MPQTSPATLERAAMRLAWGAATHVGKVRSVNEDSFLATPGLWVVADGMGGHDGGDVASRCLVEACAEVMAEADGPLSLAEVVTTIGDANARIRARAATDGPVGMGTTAVGVAIVDDADEVAGAAEEPLAGPSDQAGESDQAGPSDQAGRSDQAGDAGDEALLVFNVGDSRCYCVCEAGLRQLTTDHSYVQVLVDAGEITAEEAETHPKRNIVTRAVGTEDTVAVDLIALQALPWARLLLCSDGVSGELSDDRLAEILGAGHPPAATCEALIEAVLEGTASDNATALVLDMERIAAE